MATNKPRHGYERKRSQLKTKMMGQKHWTKRSRKTGEFMDQKKAGKFKTTSLSRRKSYPLRCCKPNSGPPVVSISRNRSRFSGLLGRGPFAYRRGRGHWRRSLVLQQQSLGDHRAEYGAYFAEPAGTGSTCDTAINSAVNLIERKPRFGRAFLCLRIGRRQHLFLISKGPQERNRQRCATPPPPPVLMRTH